MILLAFATVTYFFLHSLLADNRVKARLTKRLIKQSWYRLTYNAIAVGGLGIIAGLFLATERHPVLPGLLHTALFDVSGILLASAGLFIGYTAFKHYDTAEFLGFRNVQPEDAMQLNTRGWNAVIRHPLYLATYLMLWGWFLLSPYDSVLLLAVLGSIYLYVGAKLEERKLVEAFGDDYRDYQRLVPMLFPRFTKWKKKN